MTLRQPRRANAEEVVKGLAGAASECRMRRRSSCNNATAPRLGAEVSNPFPCSSPLRTKLSPPFSGPQKSPTAAGICASGLGVRERNDTVNCSPNADLSPKLGAWPIYSTSFFGSKFNILTSFLRRKVGIPFACLPADQTCRTAASPSSSCRRCLATEPSVSLAAHHATRGRV